MMINAHTKVSDVIKTSFQAIDAFITVSPKFCKLKNPLLRKMIASRISLAQAAKIGGVRVDDLFIALKPLGFNIEKGTSDLTGEIANKKEPAFVAYIENSFVHVIDVRHIIAGGGDPLRYIMDNIKGIKNGEIFCLINTFEPIPLIQLLERKGYESHVKHVSSEEVHTYFHKNSGQEISAPSEPKSPNDDFPTILKKYEGRTIETDVRNMEMPLPILTIMKQLESLPKEKILYVHHKKIPIYLFPELEHLGFEYFIHAISEENVKLIIRHKLWVS